MQPYPTRRARHSLKWSRREFLAAAGAGALGTGLVGGWGGAIAAAAEGSRFAEMPAKSQFAFGEGGVVASLMQQASLVGIEILNEGGNAMDAAVATVFSLCVTRPDMAGIGGDGGLVYRSWDGETAALDFRALSPLAVQRDTYDGPGMHADGTRDPALPENDRQLAGFAGHRVIGVPGVVAGMAAAHERYGSGRFTLGQLIAPAEHLARHGFVVTDELAFLMALFQQRLLYYPETARLYAGRFAPDTVMTLPEYADSLALIADAGPAAFYEGPIAELIDQDMAQAEEDGRTNPVLIVMWPEGANDLGLMRAGDLAGYRAIWRDPIVGQYRGRQIISAPPPASGGVALVEMLNILEGFPIREWGHASADYLHVLAESQKIAFADRQAFIADPDVYPEVLLAAEMLTTPGYARKRRGEVDMDNAQIYGPATFSSGHGHTNHMSVLDREGNAVAVTTSNGLPFGSGVTAPGTGFLLNDQLGGWNVPGFFDQPAGGVRPMTNMCPTIVAHKGRSVFVVGGAGASRIIPGVVQSIIALVDFPKGDGLDVARALDAERTDAVNFPPEDPDAVDALAIESGGARPLDPEVRRELERRKHEVLELNEYDGLPNLQAAGFDPVLAKNVADSDPRGTDGGSVAQ